jgi:ABC-type uncharacterized transport system YnjBCD ATPase subunit
MDPKRLSFIAGNIAALPKGHLNQVNGMVTSIAASASTIKSAADVDKAIGKAIDQKINGASKQQQEALAALIKSKLAAVAKSVEDAKKGGKNPASQAALQAALKQQQLLLQQLTSILDAIRRSQMGPIGNLR